MHLTFVKLLQEDSSQDDVVFALEDGGEDDGDAIGTRFHVQRLVVAVVNDGSFRRKITWEKQ